MRIPQHHLLLLHLLSLHAIFLRPCSGGVRPFLPAGSHLSVENYASDVLVSPNGAFSCGFRAVGTNAFSFSIWFSTPGTVVWTANRDRPVNGGGSRIALRGDGTLVLTDADGTVVWSTASHPSSADVSVFLLDSGNLVVRAAGNDSGLWQSFDSPTDTLLPGQAVTRSSKLVSSAGNSSLASSQFTMSYDSNNVLNLVYDGPEISSIYWPNPDFDIWVNGRTKYNSSKYGVINSLGEFLSSDRLRINASDAGKPGILRRLTLDPDGNLRIYSLDATAQNWSVSWQALPTVCHVHGLCGRNGICTHTPEPRCSCPPAYSMADPRDWRAGCRPSFRLASCPQPAVKFVKIAGSDFYGYDLIYLTSISFEGCRRKCEEDCNCRAFVYRRTGEGLCYGKSELFNGYNTPDFPGDLYLKYPAEVEVGNPQLTVHGLACGGSEQPPPAGPRPEAGGFGRWKLWYLAVAVFGGVELLFLLVGWWVVGVETPTANGSEEAGYQLISGQFRRFSYAELKRATRNFAEAVGRGGSGEVYRGVLRDGRAVAVKRLPEIGRGEEEFHAELGMIGRINHMNLVRMWGFCIENSRRLLVYEFVERGSLDKLLFNSDAETVSAATVGDLIYLNWSQRFGIALGIAKGLAYLHHECLEWVIHCDIKPENILLDGDYEPKIADFGLVQLTQREESGQNLSRIRGTKGYMAPEWTSNVAVTAKVDVYSYGVILLELLSGARVSEWAVEGPGGIGGQLRERMAVERELSVVEGLLDPRLGGSCNLKQGVVMLRLAVCCLEVERSKRPTMDHVVDVLLLEDR